MANDDENTISFRLPPDIHEKLVQLAAASDQSKHKVARTLVARALQVASDEDASDRMANVEEAFEAILANLTDLRMGLGRGIGAILQHVAPEMDNEMVRKWVFERIISPPTREDHDGGE